MTPETPRDARDARRDGARESGAGASQISPVRSEPERRVGVTATAPERQTSTDHFLSE